MSQAVNSDKVRAAAVACLEFGAGSQPPRAAACADYMRRLLSDSAFTVEEVEQATLLAMRIIKGIAGRQEHDHPL
jgi:hypothetical protein